MLEVNSQTKYEFYIFITNCYEHVCSLLMFNVKLMIEIYLYFVRYMDKQKDEWIDKQNSRHKDKLIDTQTDKKTLEKQIDIWHSYK